MLIQIELQINNKLKFKNLFIFSSFLSFIDATILVIILSLLQENQNEA